MTRRASTRLPLAFTLAAAAWIGGCDEPVDPEPPCDLCREPSPRLSVLAGRSFLVSRVGFPVAEPPLAAGLTLDGVDPNESERRDTCADLVRDFTAIFDARITGVDSAGQGLIELGEGAFGPGGPTFQGELDQAMADGRIGWVISLGALRNLRDDEWALPITISRVDAAEPIEVVDGRPVDGQTVRASGLSRVDAVVLGGSAMGLFATEVTGLTVVGSDVLLLPFDDFRLGGIAVYPAPDGTGDGTLGGVLGGTFSVDALHTLFVDTFMSSPGDAETARFLFEAVADLSPSSDDPRTCEDVSVGFTFEAVEITLEPS